MLAVLLLGGLWLSRDHLHRNRVRHTGQHVLAGEVDDIDDRPSDAPLLIGVPVEEAYDTPVVQPERGGYSAPGTAALAQGSRRAAPRSDPMRAGIDDVLAEFGIGAHVASATRGPTVTQYEIELGPGVRVEKVLGLERNFALRAGTPAVRMLAPVPGMSRIGLEIPNAERDIVSLGDVLNSPAGLRDQHPLAVGLGLSVEGTPVLARLDKMPHLLIAGATGRRQVGVRQCRPHLDPVPRGPRPGAPPAHRPEARRAGAVRRRPPPGPADRHRRPEGRCRAGQGRHGDGQPLRRPRAARRAATSPRSTSTPPGGTSARTSARTRTRWSWSTSWRT